jgi:predicted ATPase
LTVAREAAAHDQVREGEGNPLYLEELARALPEGALESRGRTWTITVRSDLLPPALENLLVARIDRLPERARQLARSPRRSDARFQ